MDDLQSTITSNYIENITLYYTHVTNHVISGNGNFLLATIKTGYLAVFPISRYLKDIYHMNDLSINGETISNDKTTRLKPFSLIPIKNSLCLSFDEYLNNSNTNSYKFFAGGEGNFLVYY